MKPKGLISLLLIAFSVSHVTSDDCKPSPTKVVGSHAPSKVCSGKLIFEDNFDGPLNTAVWLREVTMNGGGNNEFQYYTKYDANSYTKDGKLYIKVGYTSDLIGLDALTTANVQADGCNDPAWNGCSHQGSVASIVPPVTSAKLITRDSFAFTYGKVEIRAQLPCGDWQWPALWLLPKNSKYGPWPASGEIDIMESRGNKDYVQNGMQIGTQQAGATLHWGSGYDDRWWMTTFSEHNSKGYDTAYHTFGVVWTPTNFTFLYDNKKIGTVTPEGGFYTFGKMTEKNPWGNDNPMAPFDDPFYLILNNAVGGTNSFFPDPPAAINHPNPAKPSESLSPKPWLNPSPRAASDFWANRTSWKSSWTDQCKSFKIDRVSVWAI